MPAITVTAVSTSTDTLTAVAHGLLTGDRFRLRNVGGALPAGLTATVDVFAVRLDADNLKVADTNAHALAGTPVIDITGAGSGTTTVEYGLPYCIPNVIAAPGVQIKSADLNGVWGSLVALYDLLTGQAQTIWSSTIGSLITFAVGAVAAAGQHFTVSGTGRFKHGTETLVIDGAAFNPITSATAVDYSGGGCSFTGGAGICASLPLPVGRQTRDIRFNFKDSATGPSTVRGGRLDHSTTGTGSGDLTGASAGSGANQTLTITGHNRVLPAATSYLLQMTYTAGSAQCTLYNVEVDYDFP